MGDGENVSGVEDVVEDKILYICYVGYLESKIECCRSRSDISSTGRLTSFLFHVLLFHDLFLSFGFSL